MTESWNFSAILIFAFVVDRKKKYGQYGDRTRDIRVISTTL